MNDLHTDAATREAPSTQTAAPARRLPSVDVFEIAPTITRPQAVGDAEGERNTVFRDLVGSDTDLVGLLAYSIYKQNKYDFRVAFAAARDRDPTPAELSAYIIGESTTRRLATYRFLAAAKLGGDVPEPLDAAAALANDPAQPVAAAPKPAKNDWRRVARLTAVLLAVIAAGAVYMRMR